MLKWKGEETVAYATGSVGKISWLYLRMYAKGAAFMLIMQFSSLAPLEMEDTVSG